MIPIKGKKTRKITGLRSKVKPLTKKPSSKVIRKVQKLRKRSSIELLVYSWLIEDKIEFKKEKTVSRCHVDIFIEPNLAIEVQGCYWHRCKKCFPSKSKENQEIRLKDMKRFAFLRSRGYKIVEIWEHDIKGNPIKARQRLRRIIKKKED